MYKNIDKFYTNWAITGEDYSKIKYVITGRKYRTKKSRAKATEKILKVVNDNLDLLSQFMDEYSKWWHVGFKESIAEYNKKNAV